MKSWSIALAAGFLLFLTSAKSTEITDAVVGAEAPSFKVENQYAEVELSKLRGKYVLVSFWRAEDAQSRIDNLMYSKLSKKMSNGKLQFVSINLDADKKLARLIAETDDLDKACQFSNQDEKHGDVIVNYHLESGNRAYLINPEGKIISVNPDLDELKKIRI